MNEQQVNAPITTSKKQMATQREQMAAIDRLAESDNVLRDVIIQSLAVDEDIEITTLRDERPVCLSQKARG